MAADSLLRPTPQPPLILYRNIFKIIYLGNATWIDIDRANSFEQNALACTLVSIDQSIAHTHTCAQKRTRLSERAIVRAARTLLGSFGTHTHRMMQVPSPSIILL